MQIINPKRKEQPGSSAWEAFVAKCREQPMGADLQTIYTLLDGLNSKKLETDYDFQLQPVVDGVIPPNVAPFYFNGREFAQPIKVERTGPDVQAVLDRLPPSVRSGQDEDFMVHQIRLNDLNSLENFMGTTTLLLVFLEDRTRENSCYFLPDDPKSVQNWEAFKTMHAEYFPQLGDGK